MEIRDSDFSRGFPSRIPAGFWIPGFWFLLAALSIFAVGCAAPGEPLERKPPVPAAVSDLAAQQSANTVVLNFTLPTETVDHRPLKTPPAIEIYRDFVPSAPAAGFGASAPAPAAAVPPVASPSPTLLVTIPSGVVSHYSDHGRVRYADPLTAEVFSRASGQLVQYMIRTRATKKKASPDSNVITLRVFPAADPIADVKADVTHDGIHLTWTPPQSSPVGPAPPIAGYNIYRGEAAEGASTGSENPTLQSPLVKIGDVTSTDYQDTQTEFGNTYVYSVRSLSQYSGETVESADSKLAVILDKDIFPPAVPQGLVPVFVPAQGTVPAHVELSWAISPETDLAGYNVYRSSAAGVLGERLNSEILPTPAFRDLTAVPGRQYFYSVTAVDRSGNESAPSSAVSGGVPAESRTP